MIEFRTTSSNAYRDRDPEEISSIHTFNLHSSVSTISSTAFGNAPFRRKRMNESASRTSNYRGSPRSWTTLVQRILDCRPEIYGGPEFDFVPPIVDWFQDMRHVLKFISPEAASRKPGKTGCG